MRILFTFHTPLDASPAGLQIADLTRLLQEHGHQVRLLTVSDQQASTTDTPGAVITCRAGDASADLDFALPTFGGGGVGGRSFHDLTDHQLDEYRECLRQGLDRQIDEFNPHVVHVQHVWLGGHLALESGSPYVLTAYHDELLAAREDARFVRFVEQTAENAGWIIAADDEVKAELLGDFDAPEDRISTLAEIDLDRVLAIYKAVLIARHGRLPVD